MSAKHHQVSTKSRITLLSETEYRLINIVRCCGDHIQLSHATVTLLCCIRFKELLLCLVVLSMATACCAVRCTGTSDRIQLTVSLTNQIMHKIYKILLTSTFPSKKVCCRVLFQKLSLSPNSPNKQGFLTGVLHDSRLMFRLTSMSSSKTSSAIGQLLRLDALVYTQIDLKFQSGGIIIWWQDNRTSHYLPW